MRTTIARGSLLIAIFVSVAAGCRQQGARTDPFLQRRIIAPAPAASYGPPGVQAPAATGVPPLQPVPGPLGSAGQAAPATGAANANAIRPASATVGGQDGGAASGATSGTPRVSSDGWLPADRPTSTPPDHSAAAPSQSPQSDQVVSAATDWTSNSLDWATPRVR